MALVTQDYTSHHLIHKWSQTRLWLWGWKGTDSVVLSAWVRWLESRSVIIWRALLLQVQSDNVRAWKWVEAVTQGAGDTAGCTPTIHFQSLWKLFDCMPLLYCMFFKASLLLNISGSGGRNIQIMLRGNTQNHLSKKSESISIKIYLKHQSIHYQNGSFENNAYYVTVF